IRDRIARCKGGSPMTFASIGAVAAALKLMCLLRSKGSAYALFLSSAGIAAEMWQIPVGQRTGELCGCYAAVMVGTGCAFFQSFRTLVMEAEADAISLRRE